MVNQPNSTEKGKKKGREHHFRKPTGIPAKFSADDFIKALKVLNDKGGTGGIKDLSALYGGKKKREILSRSLKLHDKLGYANKKGYSYFITDDGRKLISSSDDSKKKMLAEKLRSYEPYKNILIALANAPDKSLKKENITEIWSTLAGGGKRIRERMTHTFASLGSWAGIIDDTGKSCRLLEITQPAMPVQDVRKPGAKPLVPSPTATTTVSALERAGVSFCPFCKGIEIGLIDEEALRFIDRLKDTVVYLKRKFICRTCQREFSRTSQEIILDTKTEANKQKKIRKSSADSKQTKGIAAQKAH